MVFFFFYLSVQSDKEGLTEIVDVMHVHLVNTDLFAGVRHSKHEGKTRTTACINVAV